MRHRWIDEQAYADLVGLSESLPGPASSQVGSSIGHVSAAYRGGLAAWTGSTCLPPLLGRSSLMARVGWAARSASGCCMVSNSSPSRSWRRHGAHAVPRPGTGFHRGRGGADHPVQRPRLPRSRRSCREGLPGAMALPGWAADFDDLEIPRAGFARVGLAALTAFFLLLVRSSRLARPYSLAWRCARRRFLPFRRAGIRRGSRGAAAAARGVCNARLGSATMLFLPAMAPRRLFPDHCSPSQPTLAPSSARHRTGYGACAGPDRDFSSRRADPDGHVAFLGKFPETRPARRR